MLTVMRRLVTTVLPRKRGKDAPDWKPYKDAQGKVWMTREVSRGVIEERSATPEEALSFQRCS